MHISVISRLALAYSDVIQIQFIISCIKNENELVKDLIIEYKCFKSRPVKYTSLLGNYYEVVKHETELFTDFFD
jgi:hypothetical protein